MIQYKHASVAAFEGYAGTSASGFRAEVEAQRRRGQTDDLLDYFDRRQGGASLGGPAGTRIGRKLDDAAVPPGPLPAMIADRARRRRLLDTSGRAAWRERGGQHGYDEGVAGYITKNKIEKY